MSGLWLDVYRSGFEAYLPVSALNPRLVSDLAAGRTPRKATAEKVRAFMLERDRESAKNIHQALEA